MKASSVFGDSAPVRDGEAVLSGRCPHGRCLFLRAWRILLSVREVPGVGLGALSGHGFAGKGPSAGPAGLSCRLVFR